MHLSHFFLRYWHEAQARGARSATGLDVEPCIFLWYMVKQGSSDCQIMGIVFGVYVRFHCCVAAMAASASAADCGLTDDFGNFPLSAAIVGKPKH
jgi:hypothetical protein